MKSLFLLLIPMILLYSQQSFAFISEEDQTEASPVGSSDLNLSKKFNIKTNLANTIFGIYNLTLEYKVAPKVTLAGSALIGKFEQKSKDKSYKFDIDTKGINLLATYHLNEAYTNSFYASAFAGYLSIDVELINFSVPASASIDTPFIGAEIGYVFYLNRLNFTLGAGGSKTFKDEETEIKIGNFSGSAVVQVHLNYHVNASIGWVF